jgi:hypothetical protein
MILNQDVTFSIAPMMEWKEYLDISSYYDPACAIFAHGRSPFLFFSFLRGWPILAAGLRRNAQASLRAAKVANQRDKASWPSRS